MKVSIVKDRSMIFLMIIGLIGGGTLLCSASPSDLTDAEIEQYFGTTRDAAPAYAIAEMILPTGRSKREVGDFPLTMQINGNLTTIEFKPTAGILADSRLPVWTATGTALGSDAVTYTRDNTAMDDIGDFTFYQDYENKAAITLYHKDNSIEGGVGYQTIQTELPPVEGSLINARRYLLVTKEDLNISKSGGFINDWGDRHYEGERKNGFPKAVYPEIMIVVDKPYTEGKTVAGTVKQILGEMNRVDMLYRGVTKPEIYLNIATVVVPLDDYTTPWIQKGDLNNTGEVKDETGVAQVGLHFLPYTKEFPDDDWDLLMSWISEPLLGEKTGSLEGGYTYSDVTCSRSWRKWRVSLMSITAGSFVAVAHEIAHFFNANHDETVGCGNPTGVMAIFDEKQDHNLKWSTCTIKTLEEYFAKEKTTCMDNIPKTLIVPDDVTATDPNDLCSQLGLGSSSSQTIACNEYMSCYSDEAGEQKFAPPEGTICSAAGEDERVCYNGQCLLYKPNLAGEDEDSSDYDDED